jgi:spermidine synthase
MKPWEVLARTTAPDGSELTLLKHPSEYVIRAGAHVLMTSRIHGSEDALATLGCRRARARPRPVVLIGGLGMGFTLRAALDVLPPAAQLVVAELVPAVVDWNRGVLGELAGHPLDDARVRVETIDVARLVRERPGAFDAILLDVDNGPAALTLASNAALYDRAGIGALRAALAADGMLALWAAGDDPAFERRLHAGGFTVERHAVRGRASGRGPRHVVLLASRGG